MRRVLSFDPASETGWAFIEESQQNTFHYGSFKIPPKTKSQSGWLFYKKMISFLVQKHKPTEVVVERSVIHHVGATIHHAKLICLIELVCQENKIPYFEVSPNEVKKKFTGNGAAKKPEMIEAARDFTYNGDNHNIADAILILFFHILKQ